MKSSSYRAEIIGLVLATAIGFAIAEGIVHLLDALYSLLA